MKPVKLYLDMYGMWIDAYLGWCPFKAGSDVHRRFGCTINFHESIGSCAMIVNSANEVRIIIHTTTWGPEPGDMGVFSHEVLHAALFCCEHIGQEIDTIAHEHLTYLHQFIFETLMVMRNMKPKKRGTKKK